MVVSNIWSDPKFIEMLSRIVDTSDGTIGPYVDGRLLVGYLRDGLKSVVGMEGSSADDLRAYDGYARNQLAYVRSLDVFFRYDIESVALDNGTTVLRPSSVGISFPGRWVLFPGGGSGGGSYTNLMPTPEKVGGVAAGSIFNNLTMQEVFDQLFYPYQVPSFQSFLISGQNDTLEIGEEISAVVTFLWSTLNNSNIVVNSINIRDVTGSVDLEVGIANNGTKLVTMGGSITKLVPGSHVFRISGENTQSQVFSLEKTYDWNWRVYAGTNSNASLIEAEIKALSDYSELSDSFAGLYNLSAGGYKYICYPSVFGWATSWIDDLTGFNVPFVNIGSVSVTNSFGEVINYFVQRSLHSLGGLIDIVVS